ncbi:acyl carrier protein [Rhodanobacter sp. C06]|uniref:acyl carrier protein n=1 Tax=Rhodanobacter sp. C06 TaxID=1945854 RepID=UPI0009862804|nr:acyl carrier protein [Rhodanobacter sp. C06]OOG44292.1 acyl carrier protein [Rhodanobacter sp. C06]
MSTEAASVEARVRHYILENLLFSDDGSELPNDASLLDRGIIDSTGVLEVVMFLEEAFGIRVKASEMLPENFDSVDNIVRFVERQRSVA